LNTSSKHQNTVELSTFGSEFIAAKTRLRTMGIPIDGPTNLLGDNQSAVINATYVESPLKKKHHAIAYHRVREAIASGFVRITNEPGESNLADKHSKPLPGPRD
jgi:hypothetical protein